MGVANLEPSEVRRASMDPLTLTLRPAARDGEHRPFRRGGYHPEGSLQVKIR